MKTKNEREVLFMKKNLLKVISLLLIFTLVLPFGVSAYTVEELEYLCEGTVSDSGEGFTY